MPRRGAATYLRVAHVRLRKSKARPRRVNPWVEDLQYELIEPISGSTIYSGALPDDDSLKFHHICNRIFDWDAFRARIDKQPYPIVFERNSGDALKFIYLDMRPFIGHFVEYVWACDEGWTRMGGR